MFGKFPHHMNDIAITGTGVISPNGQNESSILESLLASRSRVRVIAPPELPRKISVGLVDAQFLQHFARIELPFLHPITQMALLAARQAKENAIIANFSTFSERSGGSSEHGVATSQRNGRQFGNTWKTP